MRYDMPRCLRHALCTFACAAALAQLAFASEERAGSEPTIAHHTAHVEQPRSFGYFVGDLVRQHILLEADGEAFDPASLPRAQRAGIWFERRSATISTAQNARRWLSIEYQIVNAPQALTQIQLPALALLDRSGTRAINVPAWTLSVAPLTPPLSATPDLTEALKPDRAAPTIPIEPLRQRLLVSSAAFAGVLALWAVWVGWRNRHATTHLAFARALRQLRGHDDRTPEAWQILHRAFDRTAGRVTQASNLSALFDKAPHLEPMRRSIERFYEQSSEFFFGRGLPVDALSVSELCRALRRLEKQHER